MVRAIWHNAVTAESDAAKRWRETRVPLERNGEFLR